MCLTSNKVFEDFVFLRSSILAKFYESIFPVHQDHKCSREIFTSIFWKKIMRQPCLKIEENRIFCFYVWIKIIYARLPSSVSSQHSFNWNWSFYAVHSICVCICHFLCNFIRTGNMLSQAANLMWYLFLNQFYLSAVYGCICAFFPLPPHVCLPTHTHKHFDYVDFELVYQEVFYWTVR